MIANNRYQYILIKYLFVFHVVSLLGFTNLLVILFDTQNLAPKYLDFYEYAIYASLFISSILIFDYIRGSLRSIKIQLDTYEILLLLFIFCIIINSYFANINLIVIIDYVIIGKYVAVFINVVCIKLYYLNYSHLNINFKKLLFKTLCVLLGFISIIVFFHFNSFNFHPNTGESFFQYRLRFDFWVTQTLIPGKFVIYNILLIPVFFYREWVKDKVLVLLTVFVTMFLKLKGGIIFLSFIGLGLIIRRKKIVMILLLPIIFYTTFAIFSEAYYYFNAIINEKKYFNIVSHGIFNRVYFLIQQLYYIKLNFLNGFGIAFVEEMLVKENENNLQAHISLLANFSYFGFFTGLLFYLYIFKISYFKQELFFSFSIFIFIIIALISKDKIIEIFPLITLLRQFYIDEKSLFVSNN